MTPVQEIAVKIMRTEPLVSLREISELCGVTRDCIFKIAAKSGFDVETRNAARAERLQRMFDRVTA